MYIFYTNKFETFRQHQKIFQMENLFYIKKAKASYSSIIKSIFINILHKLKKEKYIVGTCFA